MRLWPFSSRKNPPRREHQRPRPHDTVVTADPTVVPFPADTFELPNAKRHGLRSLVGLLSDRHSACQLQHPFCGPPPGPGEGFLTLVAFATSQQDENTGDPVMALYLCRADPATKYAEADSQVAPLEYTAFLVPRDNVPNSKVVINLLSDGTYRGELGSIANPVEGDHSTGRLDRSVPTGLLHLDPEPPHAKWEYYKSQATEGQAVVPEFHCFMLRSEWWVVDIDRERGMYQQVAALEFADSPNHLI